MGYATCYGHCCCCGQLFSFNPIKVPSMRVKGSKEPVCLQCIEAANPKRVAAGLPKIVPAPDAYTSCREEELS